MEVASLSVTLLLYVKHVAPILLVPTLTIGSDSGDPGQRSVRAFLLTLVTLVIWFRWNYKGQSEIKILSALDDSRELWETDCHSAESFDTWGWRCADKNRILRTSCRFLIWYTCQRTNADVDIRLCRTSQQLLCFMSSAVWEKYFIFHGLLLCGMLTFGRLVGLYVLLERSTYLLIATISSAALKLNAPLFVNDLSRHFTPPLPAGTVAHRLMQTIPRLRRPFT